MTRLQQWKKPLTIWLLSLLLFLTLSAFGYSKGSETIHTIATQFHHNRVMNMLAKTNYPNAAKEITAWSWLEPDNPSLIYQLAEIHLLEHQPDRAYYRIKPLADTMTTDDFDICRLMALIQTDRTHASALDWARRANESANEAQKSSATLVLAHANRRLGNLQPATEGYRKVLQLDPDHPEAKYYLSPDEDKNALLESYAEKFRRPTDTFNPMNCTPEFVAKSARSAR